LMVHPSGSSHRLLPAIVLIAIFILLSNFFKKSQSRVNSEEERRHPSAFTTIIVVTPTHKRPERLADMIRYGVPHVYLATTSSAGMPSRGWTHRNVALQYVRENYDRNRSAVLYFADDDNTYDIRLFNNYIRKVTRIGVWAVGLVGGAWVEAPHVSSGGKVIAWDVMFAPGRPFATDMAGFAINIRELFRARKYILLFPSGANVYICAKTYKQGPESCFLSQFGFKKEDLEPFGYNDYPKEILVWHTRTSRSKTKGPKRGYAIESNN
uniref:Galactosylgalactosylxylosylprotein 3-beta-glucuronosyltransferase n=1 Tax=Haemonchus placei TaxID=6290 RepID=A0A0N4X009_HAEPC